MTFEDYPMGIRHIEVHSCGEDRQNWAGNYGAKFANLEVNARLRQKKYFLSNFQQDLHFLRFVGANLNFDK